MIRIVDVGVGNIQAFMNVFNRLGLSAQRAFTRDDLADASKLILPGVGAFDQSMTKLHQSGMYDVLQHKVLIHSVPVLGICVGMQMLASGSDEGVLPGLNWIPGRVRAFANRDETFGLPTPHMGWNNINVSSNTNLFSDLTHQSRFYFLHSYFFDCEDSAHVVATSDYGINFASAVCKQNVFGVQFHPEKSHHFGAQLLKNFAEI